MNDRYCVFHFNWKRFVYMGVTWHGGQHESLSDYAVLALYFKTKN